MQVCILAKDEDVEEVREKARQEIESFANHQNILGIPLSSNGEKPITHWFCTFNASQEMVDKLMSVQRLSIIEVADPKTFVESHNLKRVDRRKG